MALFIETHFSPKCNGKPCGKTDAVPILYHPPQIKKSPDNRLRTFAAVHCPRLMCSAGTTNAKERCNGGSGLSIGVSLFQTIVFSCHSFHKRELVGARPLHLAAARPFGRLKAPLGLSLFRFAPQTRTCRGEAPPSCCRKTVLSLKSPTGAFIVPLRFTNANLSGRGPSILLPQDRSVT